MMRQLAISTVPAYYLIGPDGKLVASANEWAAIRDRLDAQFSERFREGEAPPEPK